MGSARGGPAFAVIAFCAMAKRGDRRRARLAAKAAELGSAGDAGEARGVAESGAAEADAAEADAAAAQAAAASSGQQLASDMFQFMVEGARFQLRELPVGAWKGDAALAPPNPRAIEVSTRPETAYHLRVMWRQGVVVERGTVKPEKDGFASCTCLNKDEQRTGVMAPKLGMVASCDVLSVFSDADFIAAGDKLPDIFNISTSTGSVSGWIDLPCVRVPDGLYDYMLGECTEGDA